MNQNYHQELLIPVPNAELEGELTIPRDATSVVIFSHGSGSSRKSLRNHQVAERFHQNNIGTLLFDLLTDEEEKNYYNRFNINLRALRLIAVTKWFMGQREFSGYKIGYFGASTGAASALKAAAILPQVSAVVSRGGRPDLALEDLQKVTAPVLLIVGSLDYDVLQLNHKAFEELNCEKRLKVIQGASHLFDEHGTLNKAADEAIQWFQNCFTSAKRVKEEVFVYV